MLSRIRARLTYANVVATLALFFALGGGAAYATHLVVRSSDIVNNEVRPADVRNDSLTGGGLGTADIAPNALTGGDIAEPSLGTVPQAEDANSLGGTPASGYARGSSNFGTFSSGTTLTHSVSGIGTLTMNCSNGGTSGNDSDDVIGDFTFTNQSGDTVVMGWNRATLFGTAPEMTTVANNGSHSFASGFTAGPMYTDLVVTRTGGAATFSAVGDELNSSDDCRGVIHAVRSG